MSGTAERGFLGRMGAVVSEAFGSDENSGEAPSEEPASGSKPVPSDIRATALASSRVRDVMVPRADIVAVDAGASRDEVMSAFRSCMHSRLPVFRESLDDPVGFLHLKDLFLDPDWPGANGDAPINEAQIRGALFVPPSMSADTLLREMQARRVHMALVIDEFGGVDGLVTIEDLVEQIVGEIEDEHDPEATRYWWKEFARVYRCRARTPVDDFEAHCGLRLRLEDEEDEVDTLGGLVVRLAGRVPLRGEVIPHPGGHEFVVLEADPRRIRMLRVTLRAPDPKSGSGQKSRARSQNGG